MRRPRLVLVATWLVAVVVASAIGFFAVGVVGAGLQDRGSTGLATDNSPVQPQPIPDGPPVQATFRYDAGSMTVECRGASAVLLASAAAAGWTVVDAETGPDEDVDLTFRRRDDALDVEVYCNEGRPHAVLGQ